MMTSLSLISKEIALQETCCPLLLQLQPVAGVTL